MKPERAVHIMGAAAKDAVIGIRSVSNRDGGAWIIYLDDGDAFDERGYVRLYNELSRTVEPYSACYWREQFERLVAQMSD